MQGIICFFSNISPLTEFIQHIFVIFGVFIACIQLHRNTIAHQSEHSPFLVFYVEDMADPINELQIKNVGNLLAENIHIDIYIKQNCFFGQISSKEVISLDRDKCDSIYKINDSKFNPMEHNEIKVRIKYNSPFHKRKLILKDIRRR